MKKVNKLFIGFLASLSIIIVLSGCVKEDFDVPPASSVPYDANKILTLAQVKQIYADSGEYKFNDIYSVYAVVVMDDATGNIYKSAYVQDSNDGIDLYLNSSGLIQGDSIRIMLKGAMVSVYHGLMQIQDLHVDSNIVKLQTQVYIEPKLVTISEIYTGDYQSKLIKLNEVQFVQTDLGKTYADAVGLQSENRILETCDESTIIVRTSGYASFAGEMLPTGKGSIIAIASVYDGDKQLVIRRLSEVQLTGERCGGGGITPVEEINESFNSVENYTDIYIEGWTNIIVAGDRKWQGKVYNSSKYAQASGYNSELDDMETWLITPPIINNDGTKILSFINAKAYWEHTSNIPLTVLVSTDFDGSNVNSATWIDLNPNLATSYDTDYEFVASGDISLANYTGNCYIAFKYKGSDIESTSIQIDDVVVNSGGGGSGVTSINEDFESQTNYEDISILGWLNIAEIGNRKWQGKEYEQNIYAQATSYNSGEDNTCWLITPGIDFDAIDNPVLSFETAQAYWEHDGLTIFISTDFDGSNIGSATWEQINCTIAGQYDPDHEWIPTGDIDLSSYNGIGYIAFRYEGSDNTGETTSYRIDNVLLVDE